MTTRLTLYLSQTTSAYLARACQMGMTASGGATSSRNVTIGNQTGFVELASQGSSTHTFYAAIPPPTGQGWLLDFPLDGQQIPIGSWLPTLLLDQSTAGATVVADLHVRAFVYDTGNQSYEQIGADMVLANQVIPTSATSFVFGTTTLDAGSFDPGERLYLDAWPNITTSTGTVANSTVMRVFAANVVSAGNISVQVTTPGYQIATVTPPAIVAASGWNDTTSPFGAFYGIWQFHGQDTNVPSYTSAYNADPSNGALTNPPTFTSNSSASNPLIFGAVLPYTWAQLEQVEGTRSWSLIENDLVWWANAGKQVQLRVMAGGTKKTDGSVAHYGHTCYKATPQWVFNAGASHVTTAGTGGSNDGTIYPVYWNSTFKTKYQNFINAFAAKYDGDPRVHSIMLGVGCFGEGTMDEAGGTPAQKHAYWDPAGYTQDTWTTAYTWIIATYRAAFKSTPLTVGCNTTYFDWDATHNQNNLIAACLAYNVWLQDNGLVNKLSYPQNIQHHSNPAWIVTPNLEEQLKSAIQDSSMLEWDMWQNTQFGGLVAMIYTADILNPDNAGVLAQYGAQVTKPHGSGSKVVGQ